MIYHNITELIGNTPLVELSNFEKKHNLSARLVAKVEFFNPAGSIKDRVAKKMIDEAIKKGDIKEGTVIIEPTSGNTGIGLSLVAASYGYKVILTMPETMSVERRNLLKAYGAELVLTEGSKGMIGAIEKAEELAKEYEKVFLPRQFENKYNPQMHFETTGPEIWEASEGNVDILVAGVGTGGTITGTGSYLKEKNPNLQVIAVEPEGSPVLSGGKPGPHKLQGIGAGFIPKILDTNIYNEIIQVSNEAALVTGKEMARGEGIMVGISSGAAVYAALEVAKREENKGKTIVVILPDTGERYLSTPMFAE